MYGLDLDKLFSEPYCRARSRGAFEFDEDRSSGIMEKLAHGISLFRHCSDSSAWSTRQLIVD